MNGTMVLVTGGSGHLGSHAVLRLLADGYRVRTTVRSPEKELILRSNLKRAGVDPGDDLKVFYADLSADENWTEAVRGCQYVLHVASPFLLNTGKDDNELVVPARDGTLRVLRAARETGVARVVLTSSTVAITYGHAIPRRGRVRYTEETWTNLDAPLNSYFRSKTIAEQAAWDFVRGDSGSPELAVVNPAGIFGPILGREMTPTVEIVARMLKGDLPGLPRMIVPIVDVRDVVDLHIRAMESPQAAGQRFIAANDAVISFHEIAAVLRRRFGPAASRVPTRTIPDWIIRLGALFSPQMRGVVEELGVVRMPSNQKAKELLHWSTRSNEASIIDTAESLLAGGAAVSAAAR